MARTVNPAAEAERFLEALDEKSRAIDETITEAKNGVAHSSFAAYKAFSDATSDFDGFCILIEYRIKKVTDDAQRASLDSRLLTVRVHAMTRMLKASIDLIGAVANQKELPLGAKDVFLRELRSVYNLKNSLSRPPFAGQLPGDTGHDVDLAEKILREIIDKAPALLDLSPALPD
jgi:hypothetical protein